jgi:hypothetical protein
MFRHWLARDVTVVVTVKIAIVLAAAFFIFGPTQRPRIDTTTVEMRVLGEPASLDQRSLP